MEFRLLSAHKIILSRLGNAFANAIIERIATNLEGAGSGSGAKSFFEGEKQGGNGRRREPKMGTWDRCNIHVFFWAHGPGEEGRERGGREWRLRAAGIKLILRIMKMNSFS